MTKLQKFAGRGDCMKCGKTKKSEKKRDKMGKNKNKTGEGREIVI